jgi:hypothetical protein
VRRLAILSLKNGSPSRDTLTLLEHLADEDTEEGPLRAAASSVHQALRRKAAAR